MDLAVVGLALDTSALAQGTTAAVSSFERIEKSAVQVQARVGQTGKVFQAVAQQTVQAQQATAAQTRLAEAAFTKLGVSSANMAAALKAVDYSKVIVPAQQAAAATTATAGALATTGLAGAQATQGLRTVSTALSGIVLSEVGARAGLGSLVSAIGFFSVGSLTTVSVLAGLTAIAVLIGSAKKAAAEAAQSLKDLYDRLETFRQAQQKPLALAQLDVAGASAAIQDQARIVQDLERRQVAARARHIVFTGDLTAARAALTAATRKEELARQQLDEAQQQARQDEIQQLITLFGLRKASNADLERRKQLIAEDTAALAKAGVTLAERARLQAEINALTEAGVKKTREARDATDAYADSLERLRRDPNLGKGLGETIDPRAGFGGFLTADTLRGIEAVETAKKAAAEADKRRAEERDRALRDEIDGSKTRFANIADSLADALFGTPEEIEAKEQRFEAALRTVTDAFQRGFVGLFENGRAGFANFFDSIVGLAIQAAASVAAAFAVKELGIDALIAKVTSGAKLNGTEKIQLGGGVGLAIGSASGSALGGALGGAAGGFAVAGPIGAVAGAITGFVSGLVSHAAKARAAAEQFRQAQIAFARSLDDFVALAHPRGPLGDSLAGLTKSLQELQAAALAPFTAQGRVYKPSLHQGRSQEQELALSAVELQKELDALNQTIAGGGIGRAARDYVAALLKVRLAFDEATRAAERAAANQLARTVNEIAIEAKRLQGDEDGAARQALALQQWQQNLDLQAQFGAAWTKTQQDMLDDLHGLQRAALDQQQAKAATEKAFQGAGAEFGLQQREATLAGDTRGGLVANMLAQLNEVNREFAAGTITQGFADRLRNVITGEFDSALQQIADDAEAATLALFNYNKAAREDLSVRLLLAQGQTAEGEALRQRLADEREYAQAVRDGADAITLAMLTQVQAAEAISRAAQKAADEAKQLADALYAAARATEDLAVRSLRATGQGGAADVAAQLFAQQEETRKAIEAGRSQAFLDELARVQAQERQAADDARRAAQQGAFDQAFPTTTAGVIAQSATSVNLAVGISESTGGRMAGLLQSQVIYQASLPRIESILGRMEGILRGLRSGTLDLGTIDEGLARLGDPADQTAGVPPSNR